MRIILYCLGSVVFSSAFCRDGNAKTTPVTWAAQWKDWAFKHKPNIYTGSHETHTHTHTHTLVIKRMSKKCRNLQILLKLVCFILQRILLPVD